MLISPAQGLAVTRMGFGLYFLASAWEKTMNGDWLESGAPLRQSLERSLPRAEGFYRPFLEDRVLPNADLFAQLVAIGEWVAGISLLFGLLTRVGALTGMWLTLNYMLMKGLENVSGSIDRLFFLTCLVFLLASAGLVWGADGFLQRRFATGGLGAWLTGAEGRRGPIMQGR
ncbi:MAG: DoxX family protein [Dehalococcoidia bacterium]